MTVIVHCDSFEMIVEMGNLDCARVQPEAPKTGPPKTPKTGPVFEENGLSFCSPTVQGMALSLVAVIFFSVGNAFISVIGKKVPSMQSSCYRFW